MPRMVVGQPYSARWMASCRRSLLALQAVLQVAFFGEWQRGAHSIHCRAAVGQTTAVVLAQCRQVNLVKGFSKCGGAHRPVKKSMVFGHRENDALEDRSALAASTRSVMTQKRRPRGHAYTEVTPGACFNSILPYGFARPALAPSCHGSL